MLLYVLDNDTNTLVRISVGVGLLIELWKIKKVVDIKVDYERKILGILPRITFEDKSSYANSPTKEYDAVSLGVSSINRAIDLTFKFVHQFLAITFDSPLTNSVHLDPHSWPSSTSPGLCSLCWSATASTR